MDKDLKKDIGEIKHTMVKIEGDLRYHIKRTDLLEKFMQSQIKVLNAVLIGIVLAFIGAFASKAYGASIDDIMAEIQKEVPCKIKVTSGYRSVKHNKRVGGSKNSYHLKNRARDIQANCMSSKELGKICKKYANGVIIYNNHVHIDNRKKPYFGTGVY